MSDLQVSLLIIGGVVVGGVTAFNWFQQWRLRRRLERAFGNEHEDVLLREAPAVREPAQRVEPQLGATSSGHDDESATDADAAAAERREASEAAAAAAARAFPEVPTFDPELDYVAAIDADEPISAAGLAELHTRAATGGRRFRVAGFNPEIGDWEEAGRLSGGRYAHLRVAVQLVSRKGLIESSALAAICEAVHACASRFAATAYCPDIDAALARAREIDAYCAEVDVAIGVNIVAAPGTGFAGTRIRSLAESAGFKLEQDGIFHYRDHARHTLFTLDNHEPAPFLPEQIKHLNTRGITLLLDVPRVSDGYGALDLMLRTGAQLASGLGGTLVDDNRVALNDKSVGAIQQQLKSLHARMEARGMPAGGERALRLFS